MLPWFGERTGSGMRGRRWAAWTPWRADSGWLVADTDGRLGEGVGGGMVGENSGVVGVDRR